MSEALPIFFQVDNTSVELKREKPISGLGIGMAPYISGPNNWAAYSSPDNRQASEKFVYPKKFNIKLLLNNIN
jgi:hypothetical protein